MNNNIINMKINDLARILRIASHRIASHKIALKHLENSAAYVSPHHIFIPCGTEYNKLRLIRDFCYYISPHTVGTWRAASLHPSNRKLQFKIMFNN